MIARLQTHQVGALLAAGGMLLISLDSLGFRLTEASPWDIAFWFGLFTTVAMTVLIPIRTGRSFPAVVRSDGLPVIASGLLQAASTTFFILALDNTTVANTVVIVAAAPVIAAAVAHVAIGEHTPFRVWLAIALSIAGIVLVVGGSLGEGRLEGDLYAVAAIVAFSVNLTVWRHYPAQHRAAAIGLGGLFMALVAAFPADPLGVDARTLAILALLGGLAGPAGRIAVASATRYLSTAQVSLFAPVETIAATTWAWLFLSEAPPGLTIVGGVVVLAAVAYGSVQQPAGASRREPAR